MDILERITEYREARHWTEYQLAEKSGLTQSTISSWYRKKMIPSIPSLEKICSAFDITLSQFFMEDSTAVMHLTPMQTELIYNYNKLSLEQKELLLKLLKTL